MRAGRGGATLITASRSLERNEAFAAELRLQGYDAHGLAFDLEVLESIDELHAEIVQRFGRLDVFVNSALAREGHVGPFEEQSPEAWERSARGYVDLLELARAKV